MLSLSVFGHVGSSSSSRKKKPRSLEGLVTARKPYRRDSLSRYLQYLQQHQQPQHIRRRPNCGGGQPMKSPCDARSEAVTFLGLLRHEEDRLVERTKELVRRDRAFIQEVFTCMVDEWTPLHACTLRGARKLVKVALKAGVDPDLEMGVPEGLPGRCAPLHLAAYRGDVSILQLLVQHGAHLDKHDDLNRTPLYYAVQRRNTLAARKLIKYGADFSALSADERDFFKEDISKRGTAAVLCIPVPVRHGSQKHKHHHHNHDNYHNTTTGSSSSNHNTSTTSSSSYHHQHHHQHRSSSSSGGGGSSLKYKTDS
ncbi:GA-binding protein subunit beta-2 [Plakobranchus ocellatus]|uniref:GA-binding protein subunit beta-2 n=1 Tax=Plakobranchus ocellatus TaxID=259542 RepID=A0AAV3YYD0_9GAST|nr:GA-binding protein subunit beta-2 [Plakobranchus ocellatus]